MFFFLWWCFLNVTIKSKVIESACVRCSECCLPNIASGGCLHHQDKTRRDAGQGRGCERQDVSGCDKTDSRRRRRKISYYLMRRWGKNVRHWLSDAVLGNATEKSKESPASPGNSEAYVQPNTVKKRMRSDYNCSVSTGSQCVHAVFLKKF